MAGSISRRGLILSGLAAAGLYGQSRKDLTFPSDVRSYADPSTELQVFQLTDPAYSSALPAWYNRFISRNSGWMILCCDRAGSPQAFRLDLKNGEMRQLTDAQDLDGGTLTLLPDNRAFCYFAGRKLYMTTPSNMREREIYSVPDGWERCEGMSVGPDGTHAVFAERRGDQSRLRQAPLGRGEAETVVEAPFLMSHPIARPMRAQILYRQGDFLWLVNSDGRQNRQLKLASGCAGPAAWAPDGKTLLYLNYPDEPRQLNTIREFTPDSNTDKLIAKTSQFVAFGFNGNTSVFVGASRNAGSPYVLLLLRATQSEFTMCEHRASRPETVSPVFSPDAQRVYFQSDRLGKPAIYSMHVEKLVDKIAEDGR